MSAFEVAVVVPSHNGRAHLDATLRSIARQRGGPIDIIIVDDGSAVAYDADELAAAMGRPANPSTSVRVVRNAINRGVAAARNTGIDVADAEWISFCDDDDLWAPDKLAIQLDAARTQGAAWAVSSEIGIYEDHRAFSFAELRSCDSDCFAALLDANVIPGGGSGVVARRDLVVALGGFDETFAQYADWDLNLRLARHGSPANPDDAYVVKVMRDSAMSTRLDELRGELGLVHDKWATDRARHGFGPDSIGTVRWIGVRARDQGMRHWRMMATLPVPWRMRVKWLLKSPLGRCKMAHRWAFRRRPNAALVDDIVTRTVAFAYAPSIAANPPAAATPE